MTIPRMPLTQAGISWVYFLASIAFFIAPFVLMRNALAADACVVRAAQVVSVQGVVEVRRHQSTTWEPAALETQLCAGDSLRVRTHSRAAIRLNNDSVMRLDQRTTITIPRSEENKITALIELIKGAIHIITRTPLPFKVRTPFLNAGVEGTEFSIEVEDDHARIVIFEGRVSASNAHGAMMLIGHEAAIAYQDQPPLKDIIARPLDAVQWALYYPAIIGHSRNQGAVETSSRLKQAEYLLSVGQADEARAVIKRVLADDPDNSEALALKSIIAIVQNDKERALELAQQAFQHDNLSAPARLALSYAQQAAFDIDAALASVKQAVNLDPLNALIWARLSELQMSVGELDQALESAQEAVNLNPLIAKTQTVLGFAYLLKINTQTAQSIFHEAILLDQADPMPRLGLGLALIREGQLETGRIELEIAASLDPGNSLIRSYLGKAYFEEKRYSLAETQFELAKTLDPRDPTPWFYDAIQKQTQNRPVEALQDIQKSIELNDNRAVYRSKLLLDQDQAGRGSSLARIYDNLGFDKRAIMETAKSLSHDPFNHSAHRFLADTYARVPRHEAARVSELLQAQLMQPINVNPVQPRLAVADLNIITSTGPSGAGFNEFAPLMERNRSQFVASGFGGNNSTFGNEIVFSKLYERTSVSLGQFHYQTDGFRTNNDQNHDILNAFIQHAVTPKLNIQAEIRTRRTIHGDLIQDFDLGLDKPLSSQNRSREKIGDDTARIGALYKITSNQNLIFSGFYSERTTNEINFLDIRNVERITKDAGFQSEVQYQLLGKWLNLIAGSGIYLIDNNINENNKRDENSRNNANGYIYTNLIFNPNLNATLGFSYNSFSNRGHTIDRFNPKLGLQWNILNNFRVRFAWIENTKAPLVVSQTIEPTQVAGFNQIFDDTNGTQSRRIGLGLDAHYQNKLFSGFEVSSRNLIVPTFSGNDIFFQNQKEKLYRAYLYGLLHENWVAKSEVQFEEFSRAESTLTSEPHQINTLSFPTSISYFNNLGIFSNITGTFVHQEVDRRGTLYEGIENFFLVDASFGYRFPNRTGIFSIEARNIFDQDFLYRNTNFITAEPINSRVVPTRTIFARFTLNF
ncbi:MAG: FecR domain-containing protein [Burkholderiales bacterium]|nr:FecR domain-containing protein [Burkholderiales bacterium]MCP5292381.1 FecR domain-containing protein [Burkholderiales bacterium]